MGQITFTGLSTGIDTASIVEQLMTIESRRLAQYQVSKNGYEEKKSALDEIRTQISALKSAVAGLSDIDNMQIYTASSSDNDIVSVTASSTANTGSHSVDVDQLATTETWIQETSSFSYKTDYVGGGSFIYTYNNQQRVITAVEDETTLEDFVNLINDDESNPGVTASLLYQGGKYHLMLSGRESGEDYQISIDSSSREIWKSDSAFTKESQNASLSTKITDLDQFSGTSDASDTITISGKNHDGSDLPDMELTITENTTLAHLIDAINEHFDGTATARLDNGQIVLTDNSTGTSGLEMSLSFSGTSTLTLPTMAVSTEGGSTSEDLASISSSSFIETQNANNSKIKVDGFPSGTSNEVQTITFASGTGTPTTGTFKLTLNGETTAAIAYNATAGDIQTALEGLSGIEVGDVSVTGTDLLTGDIAVEFTGNLAGIDVTKMTVSEDSSLDAGVVSVSESTKGNDGWIHRNSNTVTDALEGISLRLSDVTEANDPITVTVNRNVSTVSKKIQSIIAAYNALIDDLKTKTEYDTETKTLGILSQDVAASYLKTQAKSVFTSIASGFLESMDDFVQASDIGITVDGYGKLEFDSEEFDNAISENYQAVLELLGATKNGSSSSDAVQVYGSNDTYTTAGVYNVKIEVNASNEIISAKIKLSTETEYRDAASWEGNIIYFDNSFDENGNPEYPEHSLQLSVDLAEGTYGTDENPVVIRVKQGIFGGLEDMLSNLLETDGQMDVSVDAIDEKISRMEDKIEQEEIRLNKIQDRLTQKYARLERVITQLQQQMSSVSAMVQNLG